ncbi:MAG: DsbA family protein [Patescibacteria group bacterium]|jgi:protein-disulfide isomerase
MYEYTNNIKTVFLVLFILFFVSGCGNKTQDITNGNDNQILPETKEIPLNVIAPEVNDGDHILGNADAPVAIIIYSDFQNPFAARFSGPGGILEKAKNEFKNNLKIVFRHYPQNLINPLAETAAEVSECAAEQGRFWEMHDKLFADNLDNKFTVEQFIKDAEELELNLEEFDRCLNTDKYEDKIKAASKEAEEIGLRGAPTIFINGRHIVGALSYGDYEDDFGKEKGLKSIIEEELAH